MTLTAGSRLGPYDIVSPLGAGGMGEVWRARDPRLGRDVAIKVLPAAFTEDTERLARFQREAQMLAALNHPAIAAIYGVEEAAGAQALVLELVEGDTLAERLAAGPLDPAEALEVARQIAEALEAAHEKGIVHRDLKPANVKVTPTGKVKVLDFGLAKALAGDSSSTDITHSPTITAVATRDGVVIGTAAYMSPEQARGKPVDKRTDIWAFGVVLYELLTGRQAFHGETVSDTLAAILTREPDWSALPATLPPGMRKLLARCLERDRNRRLHDIGDARVETEEAIAELRGVSATGVPAAARAGDGFPAAARAALLALLGAGLLAGAFLAGRATRREASRATALTTRSVIPLPEGARLTGWASPVVAVSRDGRSLAFVATKEGLQQVYVQGLDTGQTRVVPDSETGEGPFFSPDGQWVAFATEVSGGRVGAGKLKKFSLSTGLTQTICPILDYFGGTWEEDGTIEFVGEELKGVWKVSSGGGTPSLVTAAVRIGGKDRSPGIIWPQPLPGGKSLLVFDENGSRWGNARVLDLATRELTDIAPSAFSPRYVPTGHLLFVDPAGTLFAAPFDPATGRIGGSPVASVKDVAISGNYSGAFAVSDSGSLVYATGYIRGSARELFRLVRVDRAGEVAPLPVDAELFEGRLRISPDGRRIAVASWDFNLWIYDLERHSRIRLPNTNVSVYEHPVWTADGGHVAFAGAQVGEPGWKIYLQKADGTEEPKAIVATTVTEKFPVSFAPGGELVYESEGGAEEVGAWVLGSGGGGAHRRLLAGARDPRISPDGRWLTYASDETGIFEVYVQKYPELGHKQQVSAGGGGEPRWSHNGLEILYRKGPVFYAARFEDGAQSKVGAPQRLFEKVGIAGYDVALDGTGFYAVFQPPDSGVVRELHLVTNWFEELNRLAPAGKK